MDSGYFVLNKDELSKQRLERTALNKFSERSEIAQEIISRRSDFFERNSIWLFLTVMLLLSASTWFVKLPSVVNTKAFLKPGQYTGNGTMLGYINTSETQWYVEIRLEQPMLGKVDTGMKVQIRFDAYPYQQVGDITGTLTYISDIVIDSAYVGFVQLEKGLLTNRNRKIKYKPGLRAQALIVTKQMRLMETIYNSIVKTVSVN